MRKLENDKKIYMIPKGIKQKGQQLEGEFISTYILFFYINH